MYVLLALAIPTGMGLVMGLVKTALNAANLKRTVGFEIPAVFLALPGTEGPAAPGGCDTITTATYMHSYTHAYPQ